MHHLGDRITTVLTTVEPNNQTRGRSNRWSLPRAQALATCQGWGGVTAEFRLPAAALLAAAALVSAPPGVYWLGGAETVDAAGRRWCPTVVWASPPAAADPLLAGNLSSVSPRTKRLRPTRENAGSTDRRRLG